MTCDTCPEHAAQVTTVKSYSTLVKVFGSVISLLLVYLLSTVQSTNTALAAYKLEHAEARGQVVDKLSDLSTATQLIERDVSYTKENIADIKRMLTKTQVFADVPLDTSTLRFPQE